MEHVAHNNTIVIKLNYYTVAYEISKVEPCSYINFFYSRHSKPKVLKYYTVFRKTTPLFFLHNS